MEKLGVNLTLAARLANQFYSGVVLLRMFVYKPVLAMLDTRKKKIRERSRHG